jgi:hypothetical protein
MSMSSVVSVFSSPPSSPRPGTPSNAVQPDSQATTEPGMTPLRSRTRSRSPSWVPTVELPSLFTPTPVTNSPIRHRTRAVILPAPAVELPCALPPSPAVVPTFDSGEFGLDDTNQRAIVALLYDSPPRLPSPPPRARTPVPYSQFPPSITDPWVPSIVCVCRYDRMSQALDSGAGRGCIHWRVGRRLGTPLNLVLADIESEWASRMHGLGKYYIGVTSDPVHRFWGPDGSSPHHRKWKTMFLFGASTGSGIKFLERALLANSCIGRDCFWCTNIGPGGEGVPNEPNPDHVYFVYVVFGDPSRGQHAR